MPLLTQESPIIGRYTHGRALDILAASDPVAIKATAEHVMAALGEIDVLSSRTGLSMLPFVDTVRDTAFHLGEVMVAEAHIRLPAAQIEGYGAVTGRDIEHAMAMAVIDAAVTAGKSSDTLLAFLEREEQRQMKVDTERLKKVEATRVAMEAF